ncbi:MAG: pyridoxamine 5'-phosphate oxidase family protein [Candidatus Eisenbacteria bacterium]
MLVSPLEEENRVDSLARYHDGQRRLQDRFDSRRIADRLDQVTYRVEFDERDRALIESCAMFFLATADPEGAPDCSYKGGAPGFVRVTTPGELAFPDYDGNGQFRSLGNLLANPRVGLLFIDWRRPSRLRVNGDASVSADDPLLGRFPGAQMVVRVRARQIFPNCPRYIHRMEMAGLSEFAPDGRHEPPRPGWKDDPRFCDALPRKDVP